MNLVKLGARVSGRNWMDLPTPEGPDLQVRWAGHVGTADGLGITEVTLEWRVKPEEGE
jgi:hypothetical protein